MVYLVGTIIYLLGTRQMLVVGDVSGTTAAASFREGLTSPTLS